MRISRRQLTPFGHGRSAVLLEYFAVVEMTVEIEMIVDRGVTGREFLQGFYVPEFRHRPFPSSKRLMGVFRPVGQPTATLLVRGIPDHIHRCPV